MTMPISPVGYQPVQAPSPVEAERGDHRVIQVDASETSNDAAARRQPPDGMGRHVDKRA